VDGLNLQEKQETTKALLACGATIHEVNAIRKHMSRVKGGGLARAVHPATLISLILSDVIGDDLDVIASGPTVPDLSSFQDCMGILNKYGIRDMIPKTVLAHIEKGIAGRVPETPKSGDPVFTETQSVIIASNLACVLAAEERAQELGYHTLVLSTMIEGETKEVAGVHVAIAKEILKTGNPLSPPACVLSGGETTVTITGRGLGGRNQEFVLAGAMALNGGERIVVLSAGTDGTDGPTDAAGAIADGQTIQRAEALGLRPMDFLSKNDSYHFFQKLEDLVKTGPTNTNVMDLRILLVE
jgi:hydroxypyruvate reductase